mmetsp:Transcript_14624/g.41795  ORF Transcript_14624/g.41795 Transcript_14624/m.41795 type:complete len:396 (+) Transcript_14624:53-1240(+)
MPPSQVSQDPPGVERDGDAGDVYWRLELASGSYLVEAYWPMCEDWLPARVVQVTTDEGEPDAVPRIKVKWAKDNTLSILPSHWVQMPGHSIGKTGNSPPMTLKRLLHLARPDWSDAVLQTTVNKLRMVGIIDFEALCAAVMDEFEGRNMGVNRRLRHVGHKSFGSDTMRALRVQAERLRAQDHQQAGSEEEVRGQPVKKRPPGKYSEIDQSIVDTFCAEPERIKEGGDEDLPPLTGATGARRVSSCPQGHGLALRKQYREVGCHGCGVSFRERSALWNCSACDYNLCAKCFAFQEQKGLGVMVTSKDPGLALQGSILDPDLHREGPAAEPPRTWNAQPVVRCFKGHNLFFEAPAHNVGCTICDANLDRGYKCWLCEICEYNLCDACYDERVARQD